MQERLAHIEQLFTRDKLRTAVVLTYTKKRMAHNRWRHLVMVLLCCLAPNPRGVGVAAGAREGRTGSTWQRASGKASQAGAAYVNGVVAISYASMLKIGAVYKLRLTTSYWLFVIIPYRYVVFSLAATRTILCCLQFLTSLYKIHLNCNTHVSVLLLAVEAMAQITKAFGKAKSIFCSHIFGTVACVCIKLLIMPESLLWHLSVSGIPIAATQWWPCFLTFNLDCRSCCRPALCVCVFVCLLMTRICLGWIT